MAYQTIISQPDHAGKLIPLCIAMATMTKQFTTANMHPTKTMRSNGTWADEVPVSVKSAKKPTPSPIRRLNKGPAKQAVIAIDTPSFDLPAMLMLEKKSVRELPQARTVRPRMAGLTPPNIPKKRIMLTISVAILSIHVAARAKPYRATIEEPIGNPVPKSQKGGVSVSRDEVPKYAMKTRNRDDTSAIPMLVRDIDSKINKVQNGEKKHESKNQVRL